MLPRFVRGPHVCSIGWKKSANRSLLGLRVGKILNPPKTPKKKEKTNTNPPLILSKDGMIESLFPFYKASAEFSQYVCRALYSTEFFPPERKRSGARHSRNKPLLQISTILPKKSLVAKRPLSHTNVIIHENVCVRERERHNFGYLGMN